MPDDDIPAEDLWAYKAIGDKGFEMTGYPAISNYHEFRYHPKEVITGVFDDWMYEHRGVFAWTTEIWAPQRQAGITNYKYIDWFRGRRARDLPELAKLSPKKPVEAKSDAEKAQENQEKAATKDVEKDDKPPVDPTKPEPPKVVVPPAEDHKFVDKVVDKALEVLKAKIAAPAPAEEAKAKAA